MPAGKEIRNILKNEDVIMASKEISTNLLHLLTNSNLFSSRLACIRGEDKIFQVFLDISNREMKDFTEFH
jgi:hypothetical protein